MGLYVEVHCDVQRRGLVRVGPNKTPIAQCWTIQGNNPQWPNVKAARDEARENKWHLGRGTAAVCPGCYSLPQPSNG